MNSNVTQDGRVALSDRERKAYLKERSAKLVRDGQARRVPCPLCLAPPYEDCRSRGGSYPTDWHAGRLAAAGLR